MYSCSKHTKRTLASFSFEDKVCVVTGAARGLGNLFARTFVESGVSSFLMRSMYKLIGGIVQLYHLARPRQGISCSSSERY